MVRMGGVMTTKYVEYDMLNSANDNSMTYAEHVSGFLNLLTKTLEVKK